jgi:hypothetical protein
VDRGILSKLSRRRREGGGAGGGTSLRLFLSESSHNRARALRDASRRSAEGSNVGGHEMGVAGAAGGSDVGHEEGEGAAAHRLTATGSEGASAISSAGTSWPSDASCDAPAAPPRAPDIRDLFDFVCGSIISYTYIQT